MPPYADCSAFNPGLRPAGMPLLWVLAGLTAVLLCVDASCGTPATAFELVELLGW